jgi:hypothetical protein
MVLRKVTMARLLLAGVITFTAVLLAVRAFYGSHFSQSGAGQGAFYTGFVFTSLPLLLPAVFWGLYSLSGRLFGVQPKSVTAAKSKPGSISVKASSNVLFLALNVLLMPVNLLTLYFFVFPSPNSLILLALLPVVIAGMVLLIIDALYFLVKAFKANQSRIQRLTNLLLGLVFSALSLYIIDTFLG